jgi:DNA-binding transcriptional LysR family regulator
VFWLNGHDETAFANHVYPGVAPSMQNPTTGRQLPRYRNEARSPVRSEFEFSHANPGSIEAAVWRKDRLIAATSMKGSLLRKKKAQFNEILDCPLVEVMEFSAVTMTLANAAQQLGRKLVSRFHVSSTDAARRLASTGQAVTVLPNGMVEPYSDCLGLRCIEIDEKWATRHLRLLSRPDATLPAAARLRDCLLME